MALLSPFDPSAVSIMMSYGQSSEVKKERVYGPKLYLHDLCFTASLKGLFPTEYWLSDVLSISFWAPETGMNVMSSFGRLCCLPLLWFKATPLWKWVRTDFESWDVMSGSLRSGTLLDWHRPQLVSSSGWAGDWVSDDGVLWWPKIQLLLSESLQHSDDRMSLDWVQPWKI